MTVDELSTTFAALADPTRRAILARLADGEATVTELAAPFPMTVQAVSQHLRVLEQAGLVRARSEGARRIYTLAPDGVGALRAYFDEFWNDVLDSFKEAVEGTGGER